MMSFRLELHTFCSLSRDKSLTAGSNQGVQYYGMRYPSPEV